MKRIWFILILVQAILAIGCGKTAEKKETYVVMKCSSCDKTYRIAAEDYSKIKKRK